MKPSEIIREYGWTQNRVTGAKSANIFITPIEDCGGFCASGAIAMSAYIQVGDPGGRKFDVLFSLMENKTKDWIKCDIALWNDHRDRTKEEVIAKLEEVGL